MNYIESRQIELNDYLIGKTLIYLDTKYWIELKKQSLEKETHKELFSVVSDLVISEKAIFPISEITFYEVLKHSDTKSLKETIEIIDKFSKGISFITSNEIRFIELKKFLNKEKEDPLIWTKVSFLAYPDFINHPGFKLGLPTSINNEVVDKFWNLSFMDVFEMISKDIRYRPFVFKDNVEYFNTQKKLHEGENNTFERMFLSELGGAIDLFDGIFSEVMADSYFRKTGIQPNEDEKKKIGISFRNFVFNSFENKEIRNELPSFRIFAGLFAHNRWNKTQSHQENDSMDFRHAMFALPYCNFFFTEKRLATTLTQNHLAYDELYSCKVLYKEIDVLEALNQI